jgi:hypothetical protein
VDHLPDDCAVFTYDPGQCQPLLFRTINGTAGEQWISSSVDLDVVTGK